MPGNGSRLRQGSCPQAEAFRQRTEHPGRQGGIPAEGAVCVREAGGAPQIGAARRQVGPVFGVPRGTGARCGRVNGDGGPGRRSGAVRCPLQDGAHNFVPQDQGRPEDRFTGGTVQPVVEVGAADAAKGYFHHRFIGTGNSDRHLLDPEVAGCMGHHGGRGGGEFVDAGHQTTTVIPPSMKMVCPFTKLEPSEASQTAGPARSWTVPQRWAGVRPRIHELNCSSSTRFCVISVWI